MVDAINQNNTNNFNFSAYLKSAFGSNFGNNTDTYYAKKGEPTYQKDMDTDDDGLVTFDEFRVYCKENGISSKKMENMLEMRMAYQMTKNTINETKDPKEINPISGNLDLIYAEENDGNYDEKMDSDGDSKISYKEYLRYCEQNAKTTPKNNDTKIRENDKSKFMTISFGKVSSAYNKVESEAPAGKVENIV